MKYKGQKRHKSGKFGNKYNWDEVYEVMDNMIDEEYSKDDIQLYLKKRFDMPLSTSQREYYKRMRKLPIDRE